MVLTRSLGRRDESDFGQQRRNKTKFIRELVQKVMQTSYVRSMALLRELGSKVQENNERWKDLNNNPRMEKNEMWRERNKEVFAMLQNLKICGRNDQQMTRICLNVLKLTPVITRLLD